MKRTKRWLAVLLAMVLCLTLLPMTAYAVGFDSITIIGDYGDAPGSNIYDYTYFVGDTVNLGFNCNSEHGPANSADISLGSLPSGITISSFSGQQIYITGTATSATSGAQIATLWAKDSDGDEQTRDITFTVINPYDYGLIFDVTTGKFWLDINNGGTLDSGDIEYTRQSAAWSWNGGTSTLTLDGFTWTTPKQIALTIVGGDLTLDLQGNNSFISTFDGTASTYGIYSGTGITLTIDGGGTLNATSGNPSGSNIAVGIYIGTGIIINGGTVNATGGTTGSNCDGLFTNQLTVNGGALNATSGVGSAATYGIRGAITINGGTLTAQGSTCAFSAAPATLSAAYTYWTNTAAAAPGGAGTLYCVGPPVYGTAYSHSTSNLYVKIASGPFAVVDNVTVTGRVGTALVAQAATIRLFGATVPIGWTDDDVSAWFTDLPAGVTVRATAPAGADTITLKFSGTPTAASTTAFNIMLSGDVKVVPNPAAKFNIAAVSTGGGGGTTYYSVTYNSNGGGTITGGSVASGGKVTAPAYPSKDGFDFGG
jgi:hypothetical protein